MLEAICDLATTVDHDIKYPATFEALQQRERLGSTALDHGVAIPHARIKNLTEPMCALLTVANAIDFGSDDAMPVDIVFGLLVPEKANEEHLQILAKIAQQLSLREYRDALRNAKNSGELFQVAVQGGP